MIERKPIKDFPDYSITADGSVYNKNGLRIKPETSRNGYLRVSLSNKTTKHKRFLVHRLVAEAYIPNPYGLPQINHINEDRKDNRVENLEWCSPLYNLNYSNVIEKASIAKFRKVYCITTNEYFNSVSEASTKYSIDISNIVACCAGRRKIAGNKEWRYA